MHTLLARSGRKRRSSVEWDCDCPSFNFSTVFVSFLLDTPGNNETNVHWKRLAKFQVFTQVTETFKGFRVRIMHVCNTCVLFVTVHFAYKFLIETLTQSLRLIVHQIFVHVPACFILPYCVFGQGKLQNRSFFFFVERPSQTRICCHFSKADISWATRVGEAGLSQDVSHSVERWLICGYGKLS